MPGHLLSAPSNPHWSSPDNPVCPALCPATVEEAIVLRRTTLKELLVSAVTCPVTDYWDDQLMRLRERYCGAPTFDSFLAGVDANRDLWHAIARRASTPEDLPARVEAVGGKWHLLTLAEDWCGDAVNILPFVAKLVDAAANLDMRVVGRDENEDLMDQHLTGQSRSIPVIILLDENFTERGWWGPRPRELQQWVLESGSSMPKTDRYRDIRRWYVRDGGIAVLNETVAVIEGSSSRNIAA